MHLRTSLLASGLFLSAAIVSAYAADVTPQRLENAASEPQNWLTVYGQYAGYMHSHLAQINRSNVANLGMRFAVSLGGTDAGVNGKNSQEETPLVDDGYMYVNNAWNEVYKIDVRSGKKGDVVWKYDPASDRAAVGELTSRGIAMLGNNVYIATVDGRLIAVNRDTGDSVFEVSSKAPEAHPSQMHSGAPLAVGNKIIVGQSNGFVGNRGWIGAFDASTGKVAWRFFTVPSPGQPGSETWKDNHGAYKTGGAAVWSTGTYDPSTQITYWGTGDPAPSYDPEFRPGDNLYAVSTLALDVNTGALKWYFQETPNDSWDFDTISPKLIYDVSVNGEARKVVGNFSRNGYFYTLDRINGSFIRANQYVEQVNWTAGIDPKTGKPVEYDPNKALQTYAGLGLTRAHPNAPVTCPAHLGAPTYFPPTYDPKRMIAYEGASLGCENLNIKTPMTDTAKDWEGQPMCCWANVLKGRQLGRIAAVDVRTGNVVAKAVTPYPIYSGLVSTDGDLIFIGHLDGSFTAYDSDNLSELWSFNVGQPIIAPPITYQAEGKQYVAVVAGGAGDGVLAAFNAPEILTYEPSSVLYVFGL